MSVSTKIKESYKGIYRQRGARLEHELDTVAHELIFAPRPRRRTTTRISSNKKSSNERDVQLNPTLTFSLPIILVQTLLGDYWQPVECL
jgi:hypothetical protein